MSDSPFYQIIAIAPAGDHRATRKLQIALEEAFDLDLSTVMDALISTGVCISSTDDMGEAKRVGRLANKLGADVLLLDDAERVLADSRKGRKRSISAAYPAVGAPGTEASLDDHQPSMEVQPVAVMEQVKPVDLPGAIAPSSVSTEDDWIEDKAASAVMEDVKPPPPEPVASPPPAQPAPRPVAAPPPAATAKPADGELPPGAKSSGSFNLDALSVDQLVSLDGSLTRSATGEHKALDDVRFKNPFHAEDEEALELDNIPLPPPPSDDEFDQSTGTSQRDLQDKKTRDRAAKSEKKSEPKNAVTGPVLPSASKPRGPSATEKAASAAKAAMESAAVKATSEAAQRAAKAASARAAVVMEGAEGVVARLKGVFEDRRRARILLGVVIALALGGIFPAIHARSAYAKQFKPLMQELSNAEALAKLGKELAEYRTPEAVDKVLSALKLRYFAFTATLWSALSGLLAFIWFRIT